MILQPSTVELTKINYFDGKVPIPTISREVFDNKANIIIKKNIFGHRWVLKINENQNRPNIEKNSKIKVVIYVMVFCCIIVALCFGLFFTLEPKFHFNHQPPPKSKTTNTINTTNYEIFQTFANRNSSKQKEFVVPNTKNTENLNHINDKNYCGNCTQICLKLSETDYPKCLEPIDKKDPTGCGGYCSINIEFCQLLDNVQRIYQCSNMKNVLKCPKDRFNCGNMCIGISKKCDGIIHCSNHSDELDCDCDLQKNFRCGNRTSCLDKSKLCNGIVDCWDKSDEINCQTGCANSLMPCRNGECIPKEFFCDGYPHCLDKSDEPQGCQIP